MTRNYARCIKGHPVHGYVRERKGGNLTIIGSLRKEGPGAMISLQDKKLADLEKK